MRAHAASTLALVASAAAAAVNSTTACAAGLYLVVARGTSELKGTGVSGPLAARVARGVAGSHVVALDYPASFTDPTYNESVGDGVDALQDLIQNHTRACPDSRLAIMGYSQGAQVTMDALCGPPSDTFEESTPLPSTLVNKNIVAVVLFGDPTHVVGTKYDRGTSVNNGLFERDNATVRVCEGYAARMRSYCDTGDVYCDQGKNKTVHGGYIARYGAEVVDFIVGRFEKSAKRNGTASGNGTATASTTLTSTRTLLSTAEPTASSTDATSQATATATARGGSSAASGLRAAGTVPLALGVVVAAAALQAL